MKIFFTISMTILFLAPNLLIAEEYLAFKTDIRAPLKINADNMYLDKVQLEGGFSGSVNIKQGPLNLKSDQMRFVFTNNKKMPIITYLFASEGVIIANEDMTASGNNASYSVMKNEILLEGNVIVNNNFTSMRGEKLFIDLETGKINFLSDSAENNKIRGQLLENDKNKQ